METMFKNFKQYLINLDSKQIDTRNSDAEVKIMDLLIVKEIVDHMKLAVATEKEKPLLQYGTFFNGERLFYDEEVLNLSQETFNHVMLNHVFHFMNGAHFLLPASTIKDNYKRAYRSHVALYFAHFNISGVLPKYATSSRGNWFSKYHLPAKGYGLIFTPHKDTANYFYEEYEKGNINLLKQFQFTKLHKFECPEGIIYISKHNLPYLNLLGINFTRNETKEIALLRTGDSYKRVNLLTKEARELVGYRQVMDILSGEGI